MTLLILFFLLSITFSFLCSIWEAVLLSITPSYISGKIQEGSSVGQDLKEFKDDIDRPLSAILTLNTIAHTVGAIGVGASAGKLFTDPDGSSQSWQLFEGFSISAESIIAVVMTLAILILSEIIPKTLGANYWKSLTPFTVKSLKFLLIILVPLVWVSQLITKNLKNEKDKSVFSRADFSAMAQVGEDSGVLKATESSTIKNLLRLDTLQVKDIMTPRSVMKSSDVNISMQEFYDNNQPFKHSRIPVFDEKRENIEGILLKDDVLEGLLKNQGDDAISSLIRKPCFIAHDKNLTALQNQMMRNKTHLCIVVDEFGAVLGLVTMEDLFETILGLEIMDETDDVADLQKYARDMWQKRAKDMGLDS